MASGPPNYSGADWDDLDESYPQDDELAEYGAACMREIRRIAETTHRVTHNGDGSQKAASIATAALADGAVTAAKLGAGAVETAKLANGAVTAAKLANGTDYVHAASGYETLPSGLILQWTVGTNTAVATDQTVAFPKAFPNACLSVQVTCKATAPDSYVRPLYLLKSFNGTGAVVHKSTAYYDGVAVPIVWAVGY
jgi:hypothetical protein